MEIVIDKISKKFNNRIVFNDLSMVIPDQKLTGIYGASGAGKTTLLNIIGLIEPCQGTILYDGKMIKTKKEKRKMLSNDIGFIFQNFGLIEEMTVIDNIKILKCMRNKNKVNKIIPTLELLGLKGYENKPVYELSGGEQQRVSFAKIILKNCSLILADEPTASLDVANKNLIMRIFKHLVASGKTVVLVSHDQEILNQCDVRLSINPKSQLH